MPNTQQKSVNLPAIKKIEGYTGIYLIYEKREDGTYKVARHVQDSRFEEIHSLHPTIDMLVTLSEEEFKKIVADFGPRIELYDPNQKPTIPITRQIDTIV